MGSDAKKAFNADGRDELLWWFPEKLTIVDDKDSPLYDPDRLAKPPPEWLIESIMQKGVRVPIIVRLNGKDEDDVPIVEVVDGRQRVRAAIEANKRLMARGLETVRVQGIRTRGTDGDMLALMVMTNELRQEDTPLAKARKAQRAADIGFSDTEIAALFGVQGVTIKQWKTLLDCDSSVQKSVERGELPPTTAVVLAKLPRAEQKAALEKMKTDGTLRGVGGRVAAEKAAGRSAAVETRTAVPSRVWLKRLLAELEQSPALAGSPPEGKQVLGALSALRLVVDGKKPRGGPVADAWRVVQKRFSRGAAQAEAEE